MTTLIKNLAHIVTMNDAGSELRDGWILVDGPAIKALGHGTPPESEPGEARSVVDGGGALAIPGMVNTHHHLYQTFHRAVPMVQDAKLFDWLLGLYEIWRELTPPDIRTSALVGMGELLLTGCTTIADHFYVFPESQGPHLLDETIDAARTIGARFHPSRGSMSRGRSQGGLPPDDVVQTPDAILKDSVRVIETFHDPSRYSMCRLALAPCSPFSVTDDLLLESARLARKHGVRLHTHLAETKDEEAFCLETHGCRPLGYMEQVEWLGPDVWYAHGVWLDDGELKLMASTGTGIAHCPVSNLRLGSGIAPIPRAVELGVPVGLAVDGSASNDASDMVRELQTCTLVHRVGTGVGAMPARKALRIATRGGARVLGRDDVGMLAPGMAADIVLFGLDDLGLAGAMHDPVAALALTTGIRRATWVMVNGRVVVEGGRLVHIDATKLRAQADEQSSAMIARATARTKIAFLSHRASTNDKGSQGSNAEGAGS
jgi:cytosine/adenosine deaminase-related metal-dependent hydrolase